MAPKELLSLDDDQLIRLTLDGNSQAFGEIIRRYERVVARTVKGMIGNVQQAEDVGQETFIRLYNALPEFRGEAKLGTYIQRIAINLSLNEIKKDGRFSVFSLSGKKSDETAAIELQSGDSEKSADIKEIVRHAIDKLNPEFRAVVTLRMIQGYSSKETAELLEMPLGTVLSRLSRAKEQLREILDKLI